jgi:hypothetical protein
VSGVSSVAASSCTNTLPAATHFCSVIRAFSYVDIAVEAVKTLDPTSDVVVNMKCKALLIALAKGPTSVVSDEGLCVLRPLAMETEGTCVDP